MLNFNFTNVIDDTIQDCISTGSGHGDFGNGKTIDADWIDWGENESIIEIYFKNENRVITHSEVIMESICKQ